MQRPRQLRLLLFFLLVLAFLPQAVYAGLEWKTLKKVDLTDQALDVTASFDGKLVFTLTPAAILVYATEEGRFIDRIPVASGYTRISFSHEERLILSAADPARLEIIKYSRVYDINITDRPFKGAADAKVTLVVFDDYQ